VRDSVKGAEWTRSGSSRAASPNHVGEDCPPRIPHAQPNVSFLEQAVFAASRECKSELFLLISPPTRI
jgi:hypothetical protein